MKILQIFGKTLAFGHLRNKSNEKKFSESSYIIIVNMSILIVKLMHDQEYYTLKYNLNESCVGATASTQ